MKTRDENLLLRCMREEGVLCELSTGGGRGAGGSMRGVGARAHCAATGAESAFGHSWRLGALSRLGAQPKFRLAPRGQGEPMRQTPSPPVRPRHTHTRPTHPARDTLQIMRHARNTQKKKKTRQKYTKRCWRAAEPTANIPYPTPNLLFKHSNRARTCTRGPINP
jgi:hypothetical protein